MRGTNHNVVYCCSCLCSGVSRHVACAVGGLGDGWFCWIFAFSVSYVRQDVSYAKTYGSRGDRQSYIFILN